MLEKRQRDTNLVIHIIRKKHNVEFNDMNEPLFGIVRDVPHKQFFAALHLTPIQNHHTRFMCTTPSHRNILKLYSVLCENDQPFCISVFNFAIFSVNNMQRANQMATTTMSWVSYYIYFSSNIERM